MPSFRKYLGAKPCQIRFVFHVAVFVAISSRAEQSFNADFVPARCEGAAKSPLPSIFLKSEFYKLLDDLDTLELTRLRSGFTEKQQKCVNDLKALGDDWLDSYKGKQDADFWAFRAGFLFYTNPNKSLALSAAQEAAKSAKRDHTLAQYYRALSLNSTLNKDITEALIGASTSTDKEPFDLKLRRRAMLLLRSRLSGRALFSVSEKWVKLYPSDVDVLLTHFDAAIQIKDIKTAETYYQKLKGMDLSSTETSEPALLAEIMIAKGKFEEASLIYSSLLEQPSLGAKKRQHYLSQYLSAVVAMKSWVKVRSTLEQLLVLDAKNEDYLKLYEQSVVNGGLDPMNMVSDLNRALKVYPESRLLSYLLAKALIAEVEKGGVDKVSLLADAETISSQLGFNASKDIDVAYLQAKIFYIKKVFSKAENVIIPAIEASKSKGASFTTALVDLYDIAARVAQARGDWGESKRLAREGMSRVTLRADKARLATLLR